MNQPLSQDALNQIFLEARTFASNPNPWQDRAVSDAQLEQIWNLARMGPTAANSSPARIVFVRTPEAKARLKPALDAGNVDKAAVVLLLGQRVKPLGPRPCGFCGYKDCEENLKNSGLCAISIGDLGIALGSAVSVAAQHHVDNRIMFTLGRAAINLNLFDDKEVRVAYGIPISVSAKNPFFDR